MLSCSFKEPRHVREEVLETPSLVRWMFFMMAYLENEM